MTIPSTSVSDSVGELVPLRNDTNHGMVWDNLFPSLKAQPATIVTDIPSISGTTTKEFGEMYRSQPDVVQTNNEDAALLPPFPKPWFNFGFHVHYFEVLALQFIFAIGQIGLIFLPDNSWLIVAIVDSVALTILATQHVLWLMTNLDHSSSFERTCHKVLFSLYSTAVVLVGIVLLWLFASPGSGLFVFWDLFFSAWLFSIAATMGTSVPPVLEKTGNQPISVFVTPATFSMVSKVLIYVYHLLILFTVVGLSLGFYIVGLIAFVGFQLAVLSSMVILFPTPFGLHVRSDSSLVVAKVCGTYIINQVISAYSASSPDEVKEILQWARDQKPEFIPPNLDSDEQKATWKLVFAAEIDLWHSPTNKCVIVEYHGSLYETHSKPHLVFNKDCHKICKTVVCPEDVENFLAAIAHVTQTSQASATDSKIHDSIHG